MSRAGSCSHRNITEDGVRVDRDGPRRFVFVLATCRDCGQRLQQRWEMTRRAAGWFPANSKWPVTDQSQGVA